MRGLSSALAWWAEQRWVGFQATDQSGDIAGELANHVRLVEGPLILQCGVPNAEASERVRVSADHSVAERFNHTLAAKKRFVQCFDVTGQLGLFIAIPPAPSPLGLEHPLVAHQIRPERLYLVDFDSIRLPHERVPGR